MELIREEAFEEMKSYFPKPRGKLRVDDRRVISGTVYVLRNGLKWRDAPREYGPYKTLYNRFIRWSRLGVFAKILQKLSKCKMQDENPDDGRNPFKGLQDSGEPKKRGLRRATSGAKRGLGRKLHALCDGLGRPVRLL